MNPQLLIQSVIQQTTVFLAQLATAGGARTPLSQVASQVFVDLSSELQNHGLTKNVIADMFGMTLRTYHRRVRELAESSSVEGRTVWEAVLEFIRAEEPVRSAEIHRRFARDDRDVVAGALSDLVSGGFCYRSGRGTGAVYRAAQESDFGAGSEDERQVAIQHLVWQIVHRSGPCSVEHVVTVSRLSDVDVPSALAVLSGDGRVQFEDSSGVRLYSSARIDVPVGQSEGWEAAVFDHFQAMVGALSAKIASGENRSAASDFTGGATFTLDLWPGHPLEREALGSLGRMRETLTELRLRIDEHNHAAHQEPTERLVVYVGQHFRTDRTQSE
jgi:hypothetical protein